jgi:UPF0176 protein
MKDSVVIAAFYHFTPLDDHIQMREPLKTFCVEHDLKGTILLASEGINSTISGSRENIDKLFVHLKSDPRMKDIEWKESYLDFQPFERMKVRLKKEIVRMGLDDFDVSKRGDYIKPEDWDDFISQPDVYVIDTRNEYETRIGTFEGAIDPDTKNFREFPEWAESWSKDKTDKDVKIAMFCTGGIRCEKSTAYMKHLGFNNVYHLEGGILQYFEDTKNKNNKWQGECFVFDDRAAVDASLKPTGALLCTECGAPATADSLKHGPKGKVLCHVCAGIPNAKIVDDSI